jgi:hypothetical protein
MMVVIRKHNILLLLSLLLLTACGSAGQPSPTMQPSQTAPPTATTTFTATAAATVTETAPATATSVDTSTATATSAPSHIPLPSNTPTPEPSFTPTATPVPTYLKLRGKVIIDQAVCHYGPGAPYLYKYGVYRDSNLEILRRVEGGNYIEIQAIGGNNPCWVRVDYLDIKGDWLDLQPVRFEDVRLPVTPYYGPPSGVSARRDGSQVTVFWHPLNLRPGDSSEQVPYIVEAWVCQNGQMVFQPASTHQTALKVVDEPGCNEPSHARFIAAEKHGYTRRVLVPWPAADG